MSDVLKKRLKYIQSMSKSIKRRTSLYSDLSKLDDRNTARALGSVQRAPAPGKKLQKIGFIMLWVPEPTGITCAVGGPMILAGRYLEKKYNSATIHDIGHCTTEFRNSINDFKNTIL